MAPRAATTPAVSPLRRTLKRLFLGAPFKRELFLALKKVWTPPQSLYRHIYFDGPFDVQVLDRRLRLINGGAFEVETDIFWTGLPGAWERRSLAAWITLCREARVILDVGANTGVYSLVAQTVNPQARVYSFEPLPRAHESLKANVALNGYRIDCRRTALSDYDGDAVLFDLPVEHNYTASVNRNNYPPAYDVKETPITATTLSTFIEAEQLDRVDLIKIDVESHEPQVLKGMGPYLARMKPALLVEIWNDDIGAEVEALVGGLGLVYLTTDEDSPFVRTDHIRNPRGHVAYRPLNYVICTPGVAARLTGQTAGT